MNKKARWKFAHKTKRLLIGSGTLALALLFISLMPAQSQNLNPGIVPPS